MIFRWILFARNLNFVKMMTFTWNLPSGGCEPILRWRRILRCRFSSSILLFSLFVDSSRLIFRMTLWQKRTTQKYVMLSFFCLPSCDLFLDWIFHFNRFFLFFICLFIYACCADAGDKFTLNFVMTNISMYLRRCHWLRSEIRLGYLFAVSQSK